MAAEEKSNGKRLHHQVDYDDNGRNKKRELVDEKVPFDLRPKDTIYRYLCPEKKVGSIIGRGGEIVKHLRSDSQAKIIIGESIPGCEERVVTICSSSDENEVYEKDDYVCAAQNALFRVHERLFRNELPGDEDIEISASKVYARLLLPADQVGHIIGKGGQMIASLRNSTGAKIQILKNEHLPLCASRNDELLQITGEASVVKEALLQVSSRLHANPSRLQHHPSNMSYTELKVGGQAINRYQIEDDSGGSRKRCFDDEMALFAPGPDDTVYRYLCPVRKVGSIIGKGGETVQQLRADSQAKIIIGEKVPGCEERVIAIFSSSEKTNTCVDMDGPVCAAQDALLRVYERLVELALDDEHHDTGASQATVRLLVPEDQTGHIIGKGGRNIHDMRNDTGAHIRVLKDEHIPCANNNDEILQITGEPADVKEALVRVSYCLYNRPSRLLDFSVLGSSHANPYKYQYEGRNVGERVMDTSSLKGFRICLLCPSANIGGVIGKAGININQIRHDSGAVVKVDSSALEDDCIISISAKESIEDPISSIINAAVQLQPRCSEIANRESGDPIYVTRLLVPTSEIGSLIGKGGSIINEMRRATRTNIRIMPKENLPKVASEDDALVQISGDHADAKNALIEVTRRLEYIFIQRECFV